MAAFIAKQMVGNQLKSVTGAIGGDDEKKEEGEAGEGGIDPEIEAARREAEEKRQEKHRQMEAERETMRQTIRDKYGLKKKEEEAEPKEDPDTAGRIGRKKKTPEELAAGDDSEDEDENSFLPKNLEELQTKVGEIPGKVMTQVGEVTEKCVLQ